MTISHSLCDLAECDEEPIKASVASVEERWNDVVAKNDEKMDRIKNVNEKLNSIKNEMEPIEEFFTFCEQSLANQKPIGIDKEKAHEQLAELDVSWIFFRPFVRNYKLCWSKSNVCLSNFLYNFS